MYASANTIDRIVRCGGVWMWMKSHFIHTYIKLQHLDIKRLFCVFQQICICLILTFARVKGNNNIFRLRL